MKNNSVIRDMKTLANLLKEFGEVEIDSNELDGIGHVVLYKADYIDFYGNELSLFNSCLESTSAFDISPNSDGTVDMSFTFPNCYFKE